MGCGDVVRCRKVEPSERVMSWVKVYGRFGRLIRVACRTCWWFNALRDEVSNLVRVNWSILRSSERTEDGQDKIDEWENEVSLLRRRGNAKLHFFVSF